MQKGLRTTSLVTVCFLGDENVDNKTVDEEFISLSRFYVPIYMVLKSTTRFYDDRMLTQSRVDTESHTALELLNFMLAFGDDVFPNLHVAL